MKHGIFVAHVEEDCDIALEVDSIGGTFSEIAFDNIVVTAP